MVGYELVEGRPDPFIHGWGLALQPRAEITAARQHARLELGDELVSLPHLDARAVVVRDRIEGTVEVPAVEIDEGLELVPRAANVLEAVGDADALHRDLRALHLDKVAHAPRWVYQPPLAPSWKT